MTRSDYLEQQADQTTDEALAAALRKRAEREHHSQWERRMREQGVKGPLWRRGHEPDDCPECERVVRWGERTADRG